MARNKGVFNRQLDDLDELLPPPIPRPADTAPSPPAAPAQPAPGGGDGSSGQPPVRAQTAPKPRRRRPTGSTLTAEVAPEVYKALQKLTSREKARDPITARTYVQVVLDAIEEAQDELATFWKEQAADTGGGGLFSRRPAAPVKRRRHSEPTGRVPLTGLNPADAATIDTLIEQWQAPSRSALVEQALRLYEPLWPAARRRKRPAAAPSAEEGDEFDDEAAVGA